MQKIVAVINQKGGVGKTTTSINFSAGLALEGHKVLVIDMDPQAHSTIGLGIEPGSYKTDLHHVLDRNKNIRDVILETKTKNLFIVPSHIKLDKTEQELTNGLYKESRLHKAIEKLDYDFVVIDCRPTLGTLTVNALYASDFIIVPCEMARYSLDGFSDLMDTINDVKNTNGQDIKDFIRIALNKYDSRKKIIIDWVMGQLEPYKELLFNTKIRQNEALNQAHVAMEPIFTFKPSSPGAEDYKELTKEFLNLCQLETK